AWSTVRESASVLARAAAGDGPRRFYNLSSFGAMGMAPAAGGPSRAGDDPRPESPYGHSKRATERALAEAARATGIELVIIRPPLVYGPGVRANFEALLRLVASGAPLPFAALDNRRSFLHADNLTDLIAVSVLHPAAPGQVLLASDGVDLSTPALIRLLAQGLGRPPRLFPVPGSALALARRLPRIGPRLAAPVSSLPPHDTATRALLGSAPPAAAP